MMEAARAESRASTAGFDAGAPGVTPPSEKMVRGLFLADVVAGLGLADRNTVERAVQEAEAAEKPLERYLLESGILDEDQCARAVAERSGLDHVDLERFDVDMGAAEIIGRSAAERYSAVPIAFADDGALIVALADPFDTLAISDIEVMTRSEARPAIATASAIRSLIEKLPEDVPSDKPPPPLPFPLAGPPQPDPQERSNAAPVEKLKAAEERAGRLEQELAAAKERIAQLEERLTGLDTVAEQLKAITDRLAALTRVLAQRVG